MVVVRFVVVEKVRVQFGNLVEFVVVCSSAVRRRDWLA